jgi:hypothetical protein
LKEEFMRLPLFCREIEKIQDALEGGYTLIISIDPETKQRVAKLSSEEKGKSFEASADIMGRALKEVGSNYIYDITTPLTDNLKGEEPEGSIERLMFSAGCTLKFSCEDGQQTKLVLKTPEGKEKLFYDDALITVFAHAEVWAVCNDL